MSIRPNRHSGINLEGAFEFTAEPPAGVQAGQITDSYDLRIHIPPAFPRAIPTVWETGRRIYPQEDFHINPNGTICLGTPIELLRAMANIQTITSFADRCIIPYLYAVSYKQKNGGMFLFGEFAHGIDGMLDSYKSIFGVPSKQQVFTAIHYLGMKERNANKKPCACNCGKRQGKCVFNTKLKSYRRQAPRTFFRNHLVELLLQDRSLLSVTNLSTTRSFIGRDF